MRFRTFLGMLAVLAAVTVVASFRTGEVPVVAANQAAAESLDGTWQIVSLIEDGHLIPPSSVRDHFAKDGRLSVSGTTITLSRPGSDAVREIAFVTDATKSPKTIDVAGAEKIGPRGIYLRDGDTLMIAVGGPSTMHRPTDFSSPVGSNRFVMTLHRIPADRPVDFQPALPPPPKPAPDADAVLTAQLVGTWGYQDDEKVSYTTLNQDGTFSSTITWKKGFRRVFHSDVRNSGTWKAENNSLVSKVTASTDKSTIGQIYTLRVFSIDSREVVFTDPAGRFQREWKVR